MDHVEKTPEGDQNKNYRSFRITHISSGSSNFGEGGGQKHEIYAATLGGPFYDYFSEAGGGGITCSLDPLHHSGLESCRSYRIDILDRWHSGITPVLWIHAPSGAVSIWCYHPWGSGEGSAGKWRGGGHGMMKHEGFLTGECICVEGSHLSKYMMVAWKVIENHGKSRHFIRLVNYEPCYHCCRERFSKGTIPYPLLCFFKNCH